MKTGTLDRYDRSRKLRVFYIPFREATPSNSTPDSSKVPKPIDFISADYHSPSVRVSERGKLCWSVNAHGTYTGTVIPRAYLVRIAPWWVLCVILGSFLPGSSKKALGTTNPPAVAAQGHVAAKHRLAHFLAFGSTALLVVVIAETASQQLAAGLGVAALGFLIECTQFALLGLTGIEWWDVRDDTLAAIGMLLLAQWLDLRGLLVDGRSRPGSRGSTH